MATQTNSYNLIKPSEDDFYNIQEQNSNMEIIDEALKGLEDNKEGLIKDATVKGTIADADTIPLSDSAGSNATRKISFANLKAVLKTYFDPLYNYYVHPTGSGNNHIPVGGAATQILKWSGAGAAAWATLTKSDVGLGNVDNTSDANKPVSTATQTALNGKATSSHTHTAGEVGALPAAGVSGKQLTLGTSSWNQSHGEVGVVGEIVDTATSGNSRFMFSSSFGSVNVYTDGQYYAAEGSALVYHTSNITISTAAPGSALAEGAQHQVY